MFGKDKLLSEGAEARAVVLTQHVYEYLEPGYIPNKCTYKLRVQYADGSQSDVERKVKGRDLMGFGVGQVVPVRYDLTDHSKVEIDVPAARAMLQSSSEQAQAFAVALGEQALAVGDGGQPHAQIAESLQEILSQGAHTAPPAAGPAGAPVSLADELTKLADLRDRGILTDAEFAAQKARLLANVPER